MRVNNDNDSDYVDDSDNELVFFENGHENSLFFGSNNIAGGGGFGGFL